MASSGRTVALGLGIVMAGMGACLARDKVVSAQPRSAAVFSALGIPVNLDRLDIGPVRATLQNEGPRRALVVETEIANPHADSRPVPALRLTVKDDKGNPLYTWTTSASVKTLPGGARIPVRARLAAPPAGSDVTVEFVKAAG